MEESLLRHVELTQKHVDAYERYLKHLSKSIEFSFESTLKNIDTLLDLLKVIFSVSFTGYVTLMSVDPTWIKTTRYANELVRGTLVCSTIFIIILIIKRQCFMGKQSKDFAENTKVLKTMFEAERGCIEDIQKLHNDLIATKARDDNKKNASTSTEVS